MALIEYAGAVTLEVDSKEIEITSFGVRVSTGRRPVKTMNRAGRIKGFSRGITTFDITATAVIPIGGSEIDWANIEGAKLTVQPIGGGERVSYTDCFTVETSEKYQVEGEAVIDLTLVALRKVVE